ncbi:MAG: hypothetical protein ACI9OJ_002508, partial [Myxococcota bacterium]
GARPAERKDCDCDEHAAGDEYRRPGRKSEHLSLPVQRR